MVRNGWIGLKTYAWKYRYLPYVPLKLCAFNLTDFRIWKITA
jgi:hypothetical protein